MWDFFVKPWFVRWTDLVVSRVSDYSVTEPQSNAQNPSQLFLPLIQPNTYPAYIRHTDSAQ
jgi:hypothetical protein